MSTIDIKALSEYCVKRYIENLDTKYKHVETIYVAISKDDKVLCSTTPHLLTDAYRCILIHVWVIKDKPYKENWRYEIEYINENCCVSEGLLENGFRIRSQWDSSRQANIIDLFNYNEDRQIRVYTIVAPFDDKMQALWDAYCFVKKVKSKAELLTMITILKKEEKILELGKKIGDLSFSNYLLEQQRNQLHKFLDEIKQIIVIKKDE